MASILVVDDSVSLRSMLKEILSQEGHNVLDASDGENALDIAQDAKFDLVLTDVNMPIIDGIELCRELRQMEDFLFTPIFIFVKPNLFYMLLSWSFFVTSYWVAKANFERTKNKAHQLLCKLLN